MAKKKWIVIVDWVDGVVSDADQVAVYAETAKEAVVRATAKWQATVGGQWPSCSVESAWVLTPEKERLIC